MDEKPDRDDLPGTVSNQNQEEAEPGHGGGSERRTKPGSGSDDAPDSSSGADRPSGGEAGEGSQSTGNPDSAG
jgi:hypothetical protein